MKIGEGFEGEGVDAAHVNVVYGSRDGAVGTAWATALASPSEGHTPFVVVLRPNLPVRPMTLFVNKATIESEKHGRLTWGAAQAGVAVGVQGALAAEHVDPDDLVIAAVWVSPNADDEEAVYSNNARATMNALLRAHDDEPAVAEVLRDGTPENPYFRT
jgi:5,6,7,8-tetrahydromethanopterin hydro-lyase